VNRVKDYLYQQLVPLLDDALARIALVDPGDTSRARVSLGPIEHRLERARNALDAWAALITVESGGLVPDGQRLPLAAPLLPRWLMESLQARTTLTIDYKRPIFAHPEVFYETMLLLSQVGEEVGALLQMVLTDAVEEPRGVWLRAVFMPPLRGTYSGMSTLLNALSARGDADDAVFRLHVISSLMKINASRLVLQNNRKTGEQALAALLPTLTADDLLGSHGNAQRPALRLAERGPAAPDAGSTGTLAPFRLDDDSDDQRADDAVPPFPPDELESWLDAGQPEPEPDDSGPSVPHIPPRFPDA